METDPETWRWVWLAAAVILIAGEMTVPGTFILIPFGISAFVASMLAFAGAPLAVGWLVFVVLGAALFVLFWRRARGSMTDMEPPEGAGESRLRGATASVIDEIPAGPGASGVVRIGGEEWRAVSDDAPIDAGTTVTVTAIRGTRVVVTPTAEGAI